VINGLDLVIPAGATVAIVGRSGAGKSLLAGVVGRLVDPEQGEVLLDGVSLVDLSHEQLRSAVGFAFERPALVGDTIEDVISFGSRSCTKATIRQAAATARADTFIERLPQGYSTELAVTPLSGGELQRLGLARAFAHPYRVLILDDATSSLDAVTERQVGAVLTSANSGQTRLIVAHRAATAARTDLVAWLDGGAVRSLRPHHELWRDPDYRALFGTDTSSTASSADVGPAELQVVPV
jgi:ATP-binding cassette subfamily B protein